MSTSPVSPQATGSRAMRSVSREDAPHHVEVVQDGDDGAGFVVPAAHEVEQVGGGLGVDGRERLVEQDQRRVLQQKAREQRALHLAARQGRDRPALEARQADRRDGLLDRGRDRRRPMPPNSAGAGPQPHRHEIVDGEREGAVEIGGLRQVGDAGFRRRPTARCGRRAAASVPTMPLRSVDLPAPFGPTTAVRLPGRDLAVEMMHGRPAAVAERQVVEADARSRFSCPRRSSARTRAQIAPESTAAPIRRCPAERRRSEKSARPRSRAGAWLWGWSGS